MKIEYRKGDLIAAPVRVIAHGCNAQGVMGSGVAKAVRAAYPGAYTAYRAKFDASGLNLGDIILYVREDRVVANMITQEKFGADGSRYVDYGAVEVCLWKMNRTAQHEGWSEVAMPMIGAGLGGGDWQVISGIIERAASDFQPIVYSL